MVYAKGVFINIKKNKYSKSVTNLCEKLDKRSGCKNPGIILLINSIISKIYKKGLCCFYYSISYFVGSKHTNHRQKQRKLGR